MLEHERSHWSKHPADILAGIDEVGRGPLAGPVVACAVAMSPTVAESLHKSGMKITDSKQMTERQRETCCDALMRHGDVSVGLGWVSASEIDDSNIAQATHLAMAKAVLSLPVTPDFALVDGTPVKGLPCDSLALVKGDSKSLLIAAASIIAKVHRDRYMTDIAAKFPAYGFAAHKGYGTPAHLAALSTFGACAEHRRTFKPVADTLRGNDNEKQRGLL